MIDVSDSISTPCPPSPKRFGRLVAGGGEVFVVWSTILLLLMNFGGAYAAEPARVGLWDFDDSDTPLRATVGRDLEAAGEYTVTAGVGGDDAALLLGKGQHLVCRTGLTPKRGHARVNAYSLVFDIRSPLDNSYTALFQTDASNESDNECEMTGRARAIGNLDTGYSMSETLHPNHWMRLVVAVNNEAGRYDIYLDGAPVLRGVPQPVDGRMSLGEAVLVLGDDDGDDNPVEITRLAVYDGDLGDAAVDALGSAYPDDPNNTPPARISAQRDVFSVSTGEAVSISLTIDDSQQDDVQYEIDWGGGAIRPWRDFARAGEPIPLSHAYHRATSIPVRSRARDVHGATSPWTTIATVTVKGEPTVALLTEPFLQNLKPDGISVMWETNAPVSFDLRFGPSSTKGEVTVKPTLFDSYIYKAVLTGLTCDTRHTYSITSEITALGRSGSFKTAPVAPRPFAFGVWGDSQGNNGGAYAADPYEPTEAMMRHMAASSVEFGVACGDMAEDGGSYDDTRNFHLDRVAKFLGTKKPYFIAWGNHDARNGSILREFADHPSKDREGLTPGFGSYSFDYAQCHFICLDFAAGTPDIRYWLEDDLKSPENQAARYTFLFVHLPPFCEIWYDGEPELRELLVPLLEQYGVEACFSGHTHEYERGQLNGVYYVITGGGSWLDTGEDTVKDWPHMTVGGAQDLPGFRHGLVNEYVTVHVEEDGWRAETHAFEPNGAYIGVVDTFGAGK